MEDKLESYTLLHTLDEVFNVLLDTTSGHTIIMGKDAVNYYFTPESYLEYVRNAKKINPLVTIKSEVDYASNEDFIIKKMSLAQKPGDIFDIIGAHPKEAFTTLKDLSEKVQQATNESLIISNRISEMHFELQNQQRANEELKGQLAEAHKTKDYYHRMFEMLRHRVQHKFLKPMHEDSLNFCTSNDYDKVIYIKEISHVQKVYSLLEAIQEIILMLYQTPCRLCVIEPYGASLRRYQYPKLKLDTELTTKDIISSDILMIGYHPHVMEGIMHNASGSSFIIVYDRDGSNIEHVQGSNVSTFYISSSEKEIDAFSLPRRRVISYAGTGALSIDEIPDYEKRTPSERLSAYSGMNVVSEIIRG